MFTLSMRLQGYFPPKVAPFKGRGNCDNRTVSFVNRTEAGRRPDSIAQSAKALRAQISDRPDRLDSKKRGVLW